MPHEIHNREAVIEMVLYLMNSRVSHVYSFPVSRRIFQFLRHARTLGVSGSSYSYVGTAGGQQAVALQRLPGTHDQLPPWCGLLH